MAHPKVFCFGEVLWDIFPDGKKIGGAPLNVALRLRSLGIESAMISAVGDDLLGEELLYFLKQQALHKNIQQQQLPTGTVSVHIDAQGSATYTINGPVAWDAIMLLPDVLSEVQQSQGVIYGSLAAREKQSYQTLLALIEVAPFKVFDVNLRPPHYSFQKLEQLMGYADLIKCNEEELLEISATLGSKVTDEKANMEFLAKQTTTPTICLTKGGEGALVLHNTNWVHHKGYSIKVVDTVGAGDAFLATFLSGILNKNPLQESLDRACAMGGLVASKAGANPKVHPSELERLMNT